MSQFDSEDLPTNLSNNEHFQSIVEKAVSRRGILKTGLGLSAALFMAGSLAGCSDDDDDNSSSNNPDNPDTPDAAVTLGFTAIGISTGGEIIVPDGYSAAVIAPWGAPLFNNSPDWKGDASETGDEQALQVGDNHDGMHYFPIVGDASIDANNEGILVFNNEYTNYEYFFAANDTSWTADHVLKAVNAHGITVVHVKRSNGQWDIVKGSAYNRRITPALADQNLTDITGPLHGHDLMKTNTNPSGLTAHGTINNCGNGYTPWGTYLTCEENFNQYFASTAGDVRDDTMRRYGIGTSSSWKWAEFDNRWDIATDFKHSNSYGWIVEIDPQDPTSRPKKRTALGRFKHENAALTIGKDGRAVVYMGDDQANDYIYKFVSDGIYDANDQSKNRDLLESGKLYVAKFEDGAVKGDMMGNGKWILLDKDNNETLRNDSRFADQGELLIKTRLAADAVGATPMDRPEWVAVHPSTNEVYCTLTNNSGRSEANRNDANPRAGNRYGQIIRWNEMNNDPSSVADFEWDLFVLAGNPAKYPYDLRAGSNNVTVDNTFNSPDGLAFDASGLMWIQTDGNFSNSGDYEGQGNNQMLVADVNTKEIRRFLVGPDGCEVTGITWTPDGSSMFINIQHPGEVSSHPNRPSAETLIAAGFAGDMDGYVRANPDSFSSWPNLPSSTGVMRPRSAVVVITKDDGGKIGH